MNKKISSTFAIFLLAGLAGCADRTPQDSATPSSPELRAFEAHYELGDAKAQIQLDPNPTRIAASDGTSTSAFRLNVLFESPAISGESTTYLSGPQLEQVRTDYYCFFGNCAFTQSNWQSAGAPPPGGFYWQELEAQQYQYVGGSTKLKLEMQSNDAVRIADAAPPPHSVLLAESEYTYTQAVVPSQTRIIGSVDWLLLTHVEYGEKLSTLPKPTIRLAQETETNFEIRIGENKPLNQTHASLLDVLDELRTNSSSFNEAWHAGCFEAYSVLPNGGTAEYVVTGPLDVATRWEAHKITLHVSDRGESKDWTLRIPYQNQGVNGDPTVEEGSWTSSKDVCPYSRTPLGQSHSLDDLRQWASDAGFHYAREEISLWFGRYVAEWLAPLAFTGYGENMVSLVESNSTGNSYLYNVRTWASTGQLRAAVLHPDDLGLLDEGHPLPWLA